MKSLFVFLGILLLVFGAVWNINLTWVQHPEMTNRMLWITYPWQCLGFTVSYFAGAILVSFGIYK
ncbi:hypothetical protein C4577_06485 [Candidatus Parcubacteria bacterium]|nr:MAG: hypothetical protein C4577_06485 [Candidatus Parcubacteria bacterium]